MSARYYGGPILRYGGKVRLAPLIVPRLPRGRMYVEPFFGAGVDWRRIEMATTANTTTIGDRQERVDVLWMSYPPELELGAQTSLDLEARP